MTSDIPGDTLARRMTAQPRIDVPYRHYLSQVNGNCSVINSTYLPAINECVNTSPWAYGGKVGDGGGDSDHGLACCYNTTGQVSELLLLATAHLFFLKREKEHQKEIYSIYCWAS